MKMIALIKKKHGLSLDAFVSHYETNHVPLIRRLLPWIADYRRNYVGFVPGFAPSDGSAGEYDAITEVWFDTPEDFGRFCRAAEDPVIHQQIVQDEAKFLEPSATRIFVVDERR